MFFTSIGPVISGQIPKPHHTIDLPSFDKTRVLNDTSVKEIVDYFLKETKKSSGSDGVSNEIFKFCSLVVEEHLSNAFHECLKIEIFPECFKIAKVIAPHKKGDYSDLDNYRPISLLSSLINVFEICCTTG